MRTTVEEAEATPHKKLKPQTWALPYKSLTAPNRSEF